jgi:hypothetical protein
MKTTVLGVASFAVCSTMPSLALSLLLLMTPAPHRPDAAGDFLLAGYDLGYSTVFRSIGFLVPTALSASWRRLGSLRAVFVAGALGVLSPIASDLVAALLSTMVLPVFRSSPWLATAISLGVPGVVLGGVAVAIAHVHYGDRR